MLAEKISNQRGFTLVELLIVIAIFGLIANVTMVSLNDAKRKSRDAKRLENINQLRSAIHLYHTEKLSYPDDAGGDPLSLGIDGNEVLDYNGWSARASIQEPVFMYQVPRDPSMISSTVGNPCTGTSNSICDYSYIRNGINDYIIYFYLENDVNDKAAGLHAATKDMIL